MKESVIRALKNAIKMAVAVMLASIVHDLLQITDPLRKSCSVITAIIVMMSNLGSSLKASGERLIGTGLGAIIGVAFSLLIKNGDLDAFGYFTGIGALGMSIGCTVLICTALGIKTSLRITCITLALVLFVSTASKASPWVIGRERFLDSVIGIVSGLVTQLILFRQLAEQELRQALTKTLDDCAIMLRSATDFNHSGKSSTQENDKVRAGLRDKQQKSLVLLLDLGSEPGMLHKERQRLMSLVTDVEDLVEHLFSLDDAARELHATNAHLKLDRLGEEIAELAKQTNEVLLFLTSSLVKQESEPPFNLSKALFRVESAFAQLSEEGLLRHFASSELLHLCSFLFNLREIAREAMHMMELSTTQAKAQKAIESQTNQELELVYRQTTYEVDGLEQKIQLRIEESGESLEPLLRKHEKRSWAYLTAHNPQSQPLSAEENLKRQQQLETDVKTAGYPVYHGRGVSDDKSWPSEESLLVVGIDRTAALSLARSHDQRAILYGESGGKVQLLWV